MKETLKRSPSQTSSESIPETLIKAVYAAGVNCGMGHEPDKGVTVLSVPKSELPKGRRFTITVIPLSSLGTKGKPISVRFNA